MATPTPEATQSRLQALSTDYQSLQGTLQELITARQKLESQQQENKSVQNEFHTLAPTSKIYKLIGPILLAQEHPEAKMAVDGRLEFIEKEIKRIETQISIIEEQSEGKKMEVYQLQSQMQEGQGQ